MFLKYYCFCIEVSIFIEYINIKKYDIHVILTP